MLHKVIVLLLRTKQAKMLFIYYVFDVASKFYFLFTALTRWQKILYMDRVEQDQGCRVVLHVQEEVCQYQE